MRSYIKIEGPKVNEGIKALEKLALEMPEVCIMDTFIVSEAPLFNTLTGIINYFAAEGDAMEKRCATIIKSSIKLEGYDFVAEWFVKPTADQMKMLMTKIGEVLTPLDLKYTVKTK